MPSTFDDYLESLESVNKPTAIPSGQGSTFDDYIKETEQKKALKADAPKLTKSDLLEDEETFDTIKRYMDDRFGIDEMSGYTDKELVEAYVNNMRRFSAGQSVVTLGEVAWLNKADDDKRQSAGEAYAVFDNMENIFTGKRSTFLERLDGVTDYARAAIIDPANIVSLGAGKLAVSLGAKAGANALKKQAIKAAKDKLLKEGGKTITSETAEKLATKQIAKEGERRFAKEALKEFKEQESKKLISRELGVTALTDASSAVLVDMAYQNGMIKSMQQEDYSAFQTGLSAMFGMIAPAISVTGKTIANKNLLGKPPKGDIDEVIAKEQKNKLKALKESKDTFSTHFNDFFDTMKKGIQFTTKERALEGKAQIEYMKGYDTYAADTFWENFMFGNDNLGVEGLVHVLNRMGIRYEKSTAKELKEMGGRKDVDSFSSFLAGIIQNMSEPDMKTFVATLKSADIKKRFPDYDGEISRWLQANKKSIKRDADGVIRMRDSDYLTWFADSFAAHFSQAGRRLQLLQHGDKILGAKGKLELDAEKGLEKALKPLREDQLKVLARKGEYFQRTIIRNLVTNPGTTALNVIGWFNYSTLQSVTDMTRAALYLPGAFMDVMRGKGDNLQKAKNLMGLQRQKVRNILDYDTTHESFMSYLDARPEVMDKMMRYIAGGVDSEEVVKKLGFNPDEGILKYGEKYTNFFQTLYATKAQDVITKSIEFMYNIDKQMRIKYGKSYNELLESGELDTLMSKQDYIDIEGRAVDDTMKAVFGKKFGKTGKDASYVQKTANFVEEFRKIPIIGLSMPFGQFFNNTVAFMMDYSGAGAIHSTWNKSRNAIEKMYTDPKIRKVMEEKGIPTDRIDEYIEQTRRHKYIEGEATEKFIKGAVGWSWILAKAEEEQEAIDQGLAWDQQRSGATLVTKQYDYPASLFKYVARLVAHKQRGEEPPREMWKVFWDVFGLGQADRSLGVYERGISNLAHAAVNGDLDGVLDIGGRVGGDIFQTAAAGVTRPLDPTNQVVAFAEGENFVNADRRQGNRLFNNSIRYVDRVFDNLFGLEMNEKQMATTDLDKPTGIGKVVGYREVGKQSYTERMFNIIGKPNWRVGFFGGVPEADAKLNSRLFFHLERRAKQTLTTDEFKKYSTKLKKQKVDGILTLAKADVKRELKNSIIIEDKELLAMYSLDKKYRDSEIRKAIKDLKYDQDLDELNYKQLEFLEAYMDGSDDYIKRTTK